MGRKPKDITGQRFGRLVAIGISNERKNGHIAWMCQCDCGHTVLVRGNLLRSGDVRSCGCLRSEFIGQRNKTATYGYAKRKDE